MPTEYPDKTGHPIRVGYFIAHDGPNKLGSRTQFRGQVRALDQDGVGPMLLVAEWKDGAFTGRDRYGRPAHSTVKPKPANLKELEAESQRSGVRTEALALEQAKKKATANKKKTSSRRAVQPKRRV